MLKEQDIKRVQMALLHYYTRAGGKRSVVWCGGGEEIGRVFAPDGMYSLCYMCFHDNLMGHPWPEQCRIIASACGPTKHAAVLMGLAWMMFDGWARFLRIHKHAPVDVERYIQAHLDNDDLTEIPYE